MAAIPARKSRAKALPPVAEAALGEGSRVSDDVGGKMKTFNLTRVRKHWKELVRRLAMSRPKEKGPGGATSKLDVRDHWGGVDGGVSSPFRRY